MIAAAAAGAAEPATKPRALAPGDTIMIVAPAGELQPKRIELAKRSLEAMGFRVVMQENVFRQRGYLAGADQERADELMAAFRDPEVDAVFPGTGGYGTTRILDLLDFDAIRDHPKVLIGFSDITGLHTAIAAKANLVTFHSPNPEWGLGSDDGMPAFSAKYFWRNLLAAENRGEPGWVYEVPESSPLGWYAEGAAEGPICGGNLTLVAALCGSDYQLQTRGKVLFLEDIDEAPYRIDRMLRQLRHAGLLEAPAAVVLGQFRKCDAKDDSGSLSLDEVFSDYFRGAAYPVVYNFPAGHVTDNATLPLGCRVRVDSGPNEVRVLENPVIAAP